MTTLIFLICMANGQCIQQAPPQVFTSVADCQAIARFVLNDMDKKMAEGTVAAHVATFKCIEWGTSS